MKIVLSILTTLFVLAGCGSSSSSTSLTEAMGLVGITSPTGRSSSSSISKKLAFNPIDAMVGLVNDVQPKAKKGFSLYGSPTCGDASDMATLLTELATAQTQDTALTAAEVESFSTELSCRAACYGPGWTDNATGSSVNRPTGDLGLVYATKSATDTEACVSAEIGALVQSGPGLINRYLKVQAMFLKELSEQGVALPAVGGQVDLISYLNVASNTAITGITFNTATIDRLDDVGGFEMYKTAFTFTRTDSTGNGETGSVTIYHHQLATDNTSFEGLVQATVPHQESMGGTFRKRGISFVYKKDGDVYTSSFRTAANRSTTSSDFFGTNGLVDYSKAAFGEDGHYILLQQNLNTTGTNANRASIHYAWQAGQGDGATRTFAASIPTGTAGALTGTGYFGFGANISNNTNIVSTNAPWMSKMHCNWLNALSSGPSVTKVQKQTMTQTSGVFLATTSLINFAPTNDCNAASWTVSGADASFLNGAKSTTTNDLVTAPTSSDFAFDFTASGAEPTFTIP